MKKVENMPVAMAPRITLEPVRLRSFRIRRGMIGLASLDSRIMNATKRITARPTQTRVTDEPQPRRAAVTMP